MQFQFLGVSDDEAQTLVATYHKRCPLYGTVATATPEMSTTIVVWTQANNGSIYQRVRLRLIKPSVP
jgi:hypothetical protein